MPKGGGGLANSKISLSEKTGASKLLEGGGGVSGFQSFSEEKKPVLFFIDASPKGADGNILLVLANSLQPEQEQK